MSLDTFLENRSTGILTVFAVIFVLILGYLNYFIGSQISFSIFYLIPVFLLSWYVGRNAGVVISMVAALAWLAADLASAGTYPYRVVPYWNAAVLFAFFLVTTVILSRLKAAYLHEQELSRIDFLTGVGNARAFHAVAEGEKARASRYSHPLTLAYLDIDNFKVVNASGTRWAMRCWCGWRRRFATTFARATTWRGSAAMSSQFSCLKPAPRQDSLCSTNCSACCWRSCRKTPGQ